MGKKGSFAWFLLFILVLTACAPAGTQASSPTADPVTDPTATVIPPITATSIPPASATPGPAPKSMTATHVTIIPTLKTPAPQASATPSPTQEVQSIGLSAGGRPLLAHRLGMGDIHIAVVGGIHGGYEWNSILLALRMLDYFRDNSSAIPAAITLHIVPNANPDGLFAVSGREGAFEPADIYADTVPGRFNGNGVDLNRNWDCRWSPTALWRDQLVTAGTSPFSEPENRALRDYLLENRPEVVIFLHSAAGAVYVSGCPDPHPPSEELALVYGRAADYPVYPLFDHYLITGDAGDWLTTQGIPSFTVELVTHEDLEYEKNMAGIVALMNFVTAQPSITIPVAPRYEYE